MSTRAQPPQPDRSPERLISALLPDITTRRPAPPPVSLSALPTPGPTFSAQHPPRAATHELDQINAAARTSGNDVVLDALLLRLHTETACRRGGALALRRADLDVDNCLVQLREEGCTVRWQPVSPALAGALADHAAGRGPLLPGD